VTPAPRDERAARDAASGPRVLIVDDQDLVRTGLRMILTARGIDVVGEAADGAQAVAAAHRLAPDVVLMDIRMPDMDGIEATRRLLERRPSSRVIVLTTFDLDRYVYEALAAGASGFLLKDVTPGHLAAAIRLVRTGDALLAPTITRRLVERFADNGRLDAPMVEERGSTGVLTPRERGVLRLIARGLSNTDIAARLTLAEATVKTHVNRIFAKLGLDTRAQAVIYAYETGVVRPGTDGDQE
jgi:DNA-binding NarL/FixJ family response regulator